MRKELRAYIEAELRDYHATRAEITEVRDDLLNESAGPPDGMPRGSETSDPTYKRAVRLVTSRRLKYLERLAEGIGAVLSELPADRLKFVELKYWTRPQTHTDTGIAQEIPCDPATIWRWRDALCTAIAVELGLLNECNKHAENRGVR